jgi:hypothetical protein
MAPLGIPPQRRGIIIVAASFISALVLAPTILWAVGRLRGQDFPEFLFHPDILLAFAVSSLVAALVVHPARRWHSLLPAGLSPPVAFALFAAFLELHYWLTA